MQLFRKKKGKENLLNFREISLINATLSWEQPLQIWSKNVQLATAASSQCCVVIVTPCARELLSRSRNLITV